MHMIVTNKKGLSQAWVSAVRNDQYERAGDYSVTQLISPAQLQILLERHRDKVVMDVQEGLWILLGKSVHYILEQSHTRGALTEHTLLFNIGNFQVSGTPDRLERIDDPEEKAAMSFLRSISPDRDWPERVRQYHLRDFKITSIYAIKEGPKDDWVRQTNCYGFMLRQQGIAVTRLSIETLLKDWRMSEYMKERNGRGYPDAQAQVLDVPVWNDAKCYEYLEQRVNLFESSKMLPDDKLPRCSHEERWAKPDRFAAVYHSKGTTVAARGGGNFDSQMDAEAFIAGYTGKKQLHVEFRPGESVRCEGYCPVKHWCRQYREEICGDEF